MLLQEIQNQIAQSIAAYEAQIQALQAKVADLQHQAQQVQSVEVACESALTQIDTAIAMLNHVCPEQVAVFKAAVTARFEVTNALPEVVEPQPEETPATEPDAPQPTVDAVDVEVIDEASNGHRDAQVDLDVLLGLTIQQLRKLAGGRVDVKGKRHEIAGRLLGLITQADIDALN